MTTEQAMKYEDRVLESAKEWVNGESSIDNQYELVMIAEKYKVKLPTCMHHFRYSNNPNEVSATGAFKTIFKTMSKLAKAICEVEGITCKYQLQ